MRVSSFLYRAARAARTGEAVGESIGEGSPAPLLRRIVNILIGRYVVSRLWWRR